MKREVKFLRKFKKNFFFFFGGGGGGGGCVLTDVNKEFKFL